MCISSLRKAQVAVAVLVGLGVAQAALAVDFTFPSVNISPVTTTEQLVPLNPAGAPAVQFDTYTVTVNWSNLTPPPSDAFSNEARMRLVGGPNVYAGGATGTAGLAPGSGAAANSNPTTLTWTGDMNTPYTGGNPMSIGARTTFTGSQAAWSNVTVKVGQSVIPTGGTYSMDDGTAEDSIGVTGTGTFDMVWLNRFPVQSGGEKITDVQVAFGNPGNTSTGVTNGAPVDILLYEDVNGGSPTDAVLKATVSGTVQNINSNSFVNFDMPDTVINGTLVVGALMRNLPNNNAFIAGIDQTDPDLSNRSFLGFTTATTTPPSPLDPNNLGSMGANFGSTDSFGLPGNFLIRATGVPVPEPTSLGALALAGVFGLRRRRA